MSLPRVFLQVTHYHRPIKVTADVPVETMRVLVVSRDISLLHTLWALGEVNYWHLETAASGWEAVELVHSEISPQLLLLDVHRGTGDSLYILHWIRHIHPNLPVIVICDSEDLRQEAFRVGAKEIVCRPLVNDQLEAVISKHLHSTKDDRERHLSGGDVEALVEDEFFLHTSPMMQKLRAQAELLARADVPVLILGEPGSGRATVARLIHKLSVHSGFKFLRVHCRKVPAELLEAELFGAMSNSPTESTRNGRLGVSVGENGTLLLEEITDMPQLLQSRLLQALQEHQLGRPGNIRSGELDVHILVSSSARLARALAENRLREDLYYHLSAFTIHVPPLRQRKEEIKVLLQYAMHKFARHYGRVPRVFTPQVLDACSKHSWPGNLQELETFVKRYLIVGDPQVAVGWLETAAKGALEPPTSESAPPKIDTGESDLVPRSLKSLLQTLKSETEKNAIAAALEKTRWNRKAAANLLKVSYRSMLYKIDQYEINPSEHVTSSDPAFRVLGHANSKPL